MPALFPPPLIPSHQRPTPDWPSVHVELRRIRSKGVTLFLLWQKYKAAHPDDFHMPEATGVPW